jgi:crotonobetainyl-CoA:carnitine CoA-transferase CaiB-like acyl-CoA transferase
VTAGAMQRGSDLGRDPQLKHRGFYKQIDHPGIGPVTCGGLSPVLSGTPYVTKRAPYLGEHTEAMFVGEMGMPRDEYEQLKSEGAFE